MPFVSYYVKNAMWDQLSVSSTWKIMIRRFNLHLRERLFSIARKIANQLFLFGVNADDGIAIFNEHGFQFGNVFKLSISVSVIAQ